MKFRILNRRTLSEGTEKRYFQQKEAHFNKHEVKLSPKNKVACLDTTLVLCCVLFLVVLPKSRVSEYFNINIG